MIFISPPPKYFLSNSSYRQLFQCKSMTDIQNVYNEAKILISCYSGPDLESILTLFHESRNLILYLLLGQKLCQHAMQIETSRIDMNKSQLQKSEKESREILSPIMNQLKDKADELKKAQGEYLMVEKSTLIFKTQVENATARKIKLEQLLLQDPTKNKHPETCASGSNTTKVEHDYVDALKALKTAEARWIIAQQVSSKEKLNYEMMDKEVSQSVSTLKEQLVSLQKHLVDCKTKLSTDIAFSNKMIAQAKSHLAQIQILSLHVQDHAVNWIENAFTSTQHIEELKQGMIQLIECIKFLVQDHFPPFIEDLNEECQLFTVDIMDMRLRQFEFTSTHCHNCALPKLINPDAGVEFCMICPAVNAIMESIPSGTCTTTTATTTSTSAASDEVVEDDISRSPPLYILNTAVAERLLEKEIARRISNGWSIENVPICIECGTQGIMNPSGQVVPCILCTADAYFLQRIVTREIGILVQKGWYLHETSCEECGVFFMSNSLDSPLQCIVCEQIL